MNDNLNNFNIALKRMARTMGVFGLLIFDYLTSGLVIFLIIDDLLNFQDSPVYSVVIFAIALSFSVFLSAVPQAIADGVFNGTYKLEKNALSFAIFFIGLGFVYLDVYIDGMIAPFLLYGESPMMYWHYMRQGSVEFVSTVGIFRILSVIAEPGVIILLRWKLAKLKLPKVTKRKPINKPKGAKAKKVTTNRNGFPGN